MSDFSDLKLLPLVQGSITAQGYKRPSQAKRASKKKLLEKLEKVNND